MQSAYLYVIVHVKHEKLPFLEVLTWSLILGKIQDGGQDSRLLLVTSQASSSATTHEIYLILLRRSNAFHLKILQHWSKTPGGYEKKIENQTFRVYDRSSVWAGKL